MFYRVHSKNSKKTRKNSQKLENASPIIDWNNCHTSEQIDSIATTKDDLAVDCISRDEVKYYIQAYIHEIITESGIDKNAHTNGVLRALLNEVDIMPSVTPQYSSGFEKNSQKLEKDLSESDCVNRQAINGYIDYIISHGMGKKKSFDFIKKFVANLPPVTPQEPRKGHCKDCKYFEYDSMANVDGIPLIVAHEICSKWGDGCKTRENGYCYLFEPKAD